MLKVGDIVQVINWEKRPDHWNHYGKMDHYCGRIVTIATILVNGKIRIKETNRWVWYECDFKEPFLDNDMFTI